MAGNEPGSHLGPYELVNPVGTGPIGTVWRARRLSDSHWVALKILAEDLAADAATAERFRYEAKRSEPIHHPCIGMVYEVSEVDGRLFSVEEPIAGRPIRDLRLPLPPTAAISLVRQILEALSAAAVAGVTHGSLKPQNVFCDTHGHITLMHFGSGRVAEPARLAKVDPVNGGLQYLSPESARGGDGGVPGDIYSVAAIAFLLLMGSPPYEGSDAATLLKNVSHNPFPPLADIIPAPIQEWIGRCARTVPSDRFSSEQEALQMLEVALKEPKVTPVVIGQPMSTLTTETSSTVINGPSPTAIDDSASMVRNALIYLRRGTLPEARESCQRALQFDPNNLEAHDIMGQILEREGNDVGAYREYQAACPLESPWPQAETHLAMLLVRLPPGTARMLVPSHTRGKDDLPPEVENRLPDEARTILARAALSTAAPPVQQGSGVLMMASLCAPGLGQLIDERFLLGGIMIGVWLVCAIALMGMFSGGHGGHATMSDPSLWIVVGVMVLDYVVSLADLALSRSGSDASLGG